MCTASMSLAEVDIIMDNTLQNFHQFVRGFVVVFKKRYGCRYCTAERCRIPLADLLE